MTFSSEIKAYIAACRAEKTAAGYGYAHKYLQRYFRSEVIAFEDLTYTTIATFDRWLEREGLSMNSRSIVMRNIRAVFNNAIKSDKISPSAYPFRKFEIKNARKEIIEGIVLNYINFQSLIATKTARIWLCSKKAPVMEFGLRRAQGPDGAMSATRAAYIGGVAGTSNTLAAKTYGIPVMGTMAHSWVMSFNSELEAFEKYAELYPENSVFLIDTYDTLGSGIKNAIKAGKKLVEQGHNFGVRLDSGDIEYLSRQVRRELDNAGFKSATISASNDLTEEIISTLVANKAPIDSWGVGTNLVTGGYESAFTGVYKLCGRYNAQAGCIQPTMKFSDNPEKMTNPGVKNVFRLYDENGIAGADIIGLENDTIKENVEQRFFHPLIDYRQFTFTPSRVESLLKKRVENGKRITKGLSASEQIKQSRSIMEKQLETFDESYKRILNPHIYKVSLTENLKELKKTFIEANIK